MNTKKTLVKAVYTAPRLTVHGNVEAMTQTWIRCVPHHVYNCPRCNTPSS